MSTTSIATTIATIEEDDGTASIHSVKGVTPEMLSQQAHKSTTSLASTQTNASTGNVSAKAATLYSMSASKRSLPASATTVKSISQASLPARDSVDLESNPPSPVDSPNGSAIELSSIADTSRPTTMQNDSRAALDRVPEGAASLPPTDKGAGAWIALSAAFLFEFLVWGFAFTYPIFYQYFSNNESFKSQSASALSGIGTLSTGLLYIGGAFTGLVLEMYPRYRKTLMYSGICISGLSLLLAGLSTQLWQLYLTFGFLQGVGGAIAYIPLMGYVSEWFVQRRGLAVGIVFAATGLGGIIFPTVVQTMLDKLGYRITLMIWSPIVFFPNIIAVYFVRARLPVASVRVTRRHVNPRFLKKGLFWILTAAVVTQAVSQFPVSTFLPTYATSVGLSASLGTLFLSIMNGSRIFGQIIHGYCADRFGFEYTAMVSSSLAALSAGLLWNYAGDSVGLLSMFSILFGLTAMGYSSILNAISATVAGDPNDYALVYGVFVAVRGLGSVIGAPLASIMLGNKSGNIGDGSEKSAVKAFSPLVYFCTIVMAVSAACEMAAALMTRRHDQRSTRA